jgi:serine/threonine-protein kinase
MLTGRPMYDGTPSKVMLAHTRTPMPDPRTYRPSLSDDVVNMLMRMLEKDPNKRYANITSLFADLEALRDAHTAKAATRYEIGKSSIMRALNIEKSRHNEMAEKIKAAEAKAEAASAAAKVAWGVAAGAGIAAITFLILWLAT